MRINKYIAQAGVASRRKADELIANGNVKVNGAVMKEPGYDVQEGDKVICLKNEWDIIADNYDPLVNGTIGFLKNSYSTFVSVPRFLGGHHFDVLQSDFVSDGGALFRNINMDKKMIMTVNDADKEEAVEVGKRFKALGYDIFATRGTAKVLNDNGVLALAS